MLPVHGILWIPGLVDGGHRVVWMDGLVFEVDSSLGALGDIGLAKGNEHTQTALRHGFIHQHWTNVLRNHLSVLKLDPAYTAFLSEKLRINE